MATAASTVMALTYGVLARLLDLPEDEERAVGGDLDGDLGVLDVLLPEVLGDDVGELVGGEAARADRSVRGMATAPEPSTL